MLPALAQHAWAVTGVLSCPGQEGAHGAEELDPRGRTSPAPAEPRWPLELRSQQCLGRGAWLHVPGRRPRLWSRVWSGCSGCAAAPTSLRGPASALVAALPSRCPACPGLVTGRRRARVSGNRESPGLPQGSGHTCAHCPPKPWPAEGTQAPSLPDAPRAGRDTAQPPEVGPCVWGSS